MVWNLYTWVILKKSAKSKDLALFLFNNLIEYKIIRFLVSFTFGFDVQSSHHDRIKPFKRYKRMVLNIVGIYFNSKYIKNLKPVIAPTKKGQLPKLPLTRKIHHFLS
ncbi:hypothetical protein HYN59_15050 [Flavobacterium album]|uniref:Uncharacterized protein n=1 Tax=Flavobacterium album TaxID=2175091 RepID=A0A2S1R0W3_9FLAO|nr:hypothetical protein HYN59_15050 [Flavobacterium album]